MPLKQIASPFLRTGNIPWTPWAMPGTSFKLLNIERCSGRFTFLLRVEPGVTAPIHKHIGAAEGFILEGDFAYDDDEGVAGDYVWEEAGALHVPVSRSGLIMFAIAHGPVVGYDEDGRVAGIVDWEWMLSAAAENGAASHIDLSSRFEPA